jgi:CheY-like chemotaxis protein
VERILAGRRVLIVEDEPDNQELMRTVVEELLGGAAVVCGDGERAVFEAVETPPALILLDLMLPSLSGWEVARAPAPEPAHQDRPDHRRDRARSPARARVGSSRGM